MMNQIEIKRTSCDAPVIDKNLEYVDFLIAIQNEKKRSEIIAVLKFAGLLRE